VTERLAVGNAYVNRNQIGAIVASQPFGGEGLSGTGPKAGGPDYLAKEQAKLAEAQGCVPLIVAPEASGADAIPFFLERGHLATLKGFDAVMLWSGEDDLRAARIALAKRDGPLVPLISEADPAERLILERHVCIDTTAAGGNAALLAANA
jgi:RHH-type proline utilization regulon transcriptional repressor/proline dehydrogenase/delta 1-pyrroline-5-carboxylate dehydrogenase